MVSLSHGNTINNWRCVSFKFVLISFKLLSKGGKCLKIWLALVEKEAEEHANADEGQQMRWAAEERQIAVAEIERNRGVKIETHSRLDGLLLTVYKDIRAWQGAMPSKAVHQSWGSSSQVLQEPSPTILFPSLRKTSCGIPATQHSFFLLNRCTNPWNPHLKWLKSS